MALLRGIREVGVNGAEVNGVRVNGDRVNGAVANVGLPCWGGCWEIKGWSEKTGAITRVG